MKKLLMLTIVSWQLLPAVAFGQKQDQKLSLGLVYELATIKAKSEAILQFSLLKEPAKPDPDVVKKYMAVKAAFDPIISQLAADIQAQNSLRYYKGLDALVKGSQSLCKLTPSNDESMQRYSLALCSADTVYDKLTKTDEGPPVVGDVISAATLVYSIIKDAQDARTAKVTKVAALLESLRLSPVESIGKAEGK